MTRIYFYGNSVLILSKIIELIKQFNMIQDSVIFSEYKKIDPSSLKLYSFDQAHTLVLDQIKILIIAGFDDSYFRLFYRNESHFSFPLNLRVLLRNTRNILTILIHDQHSNPIPAISLRNIYTVSSLSRYVSPSLEKRIRSLFTTNHSELVEICNETNLYKYYGYIIPLIYEYITNKTVIKCSKMTKSRNLLSLEVIKNGIFNMLNHMHSKNISYKYEQSYSRIINGRQITGNIDCIINDRHIWELKFVTQITPSHMLQLILYSWIMNIADNSTYNILNIRTGEIIKLNYSRDIIDEIVKSLLIH